MKKLVVVFSVIALAAASIGWQRSSPQNSAGTTQFAVADRLAIQNVVANLFINLDSFNLDAWGQAYTDDATFIVIDADKPAFQLSRNQLDTGMRERFRQFKAAGKQRRHVMTNLAFISQAKDAAHVKCNGVLLSTENYRKTEVVSTLYGEGWFVKNGGEWRVQKWAIGNDAPINSKRDVESYGIEPAKVDGL